VNVARGVTSNAHFEEAPLMRIDRSRFFILTTALAAASGCTVINNEQAADGGGTDSGTTADSGTGDATLGDSSSDTAPSETSSETSSEVSSETSSDGGSDADAACTDDVPAPSDCASILTGTGCHDATLPTPADNSCGNWVADLKPREAKAAQDCLVAKMTAAADPDAGEAGIGPTCEGIDWSNCALDALATSCTDDTAAVYCEGILTACAALSADAAADAPTTPPTTLTDCTTLAAGLTDAGRTAIQTCVMEGGCAVPLRDCIKAL
jgi:hypothetical protein